MSHNQSENQNENTLKRTSDDVAKVNDVEIVDQSEKKLGNSNFEAPMKKRTKLRIKKEDELSPAFIQNANEVTFFKIIHSEKEFSEFQSMSNMEYSFNPSYTIQIFPNEEIITGYKNLKILISLTPKMLFPHIKITYEKCLKVKDDIELLLKQHYETAYETDDEKFLAKLKAEIEKESAPKGKLIVSEVDKKTNKNLEIYHVDILKEQAITENFNLQAMCTFLVDGASFIPYEDSFWSYYILYEKSTNEQSNKTNYNLIAFASCLNFYLSIDKHRTMVSQFLTLPPYQRKGLGHFLLDRVYSYISECNPECIEITTEDPAEEFILLRDITIFNKILNLGFFDEFIASYPVKTIEEFNKIRFSPEKVKQILEKIKVSKNLIKRSILILKYILSGVSKDLFNKFKSDSQELIYKWNRADFEYDYYIKRNKKGGPYICFHDEEDFDVEQALNELKYLNNNEQTSKIK